MDEMNKKMLLDEEKLEKIAGGKIEWEQIFMKCDKCGTEIPVYELVNQEPYAAEGKYLHKGCGGMLEVTVKR